jgi:ferredoxin-type protein NapH
MDLQGQNGLMATYREPYRNRSFVAFVVAALLMSFYCTLYFTDALDPLSRALGLRNKWFLYGALYSIAMTAGAIYHLRRHGNALYNRVRILTNVGIQIVLGFSLPFVMGMFDAPEFYFSYLWPLDIYKLYPQTLESLPVYLAVYAVVGSLVVAPVLALFFGKRWYCSWVCGCGGLANTFGDPYRHLTSKSDASFRFEKASIYTVLVLAIVTTVLVGLDFAIGAHHRTLHRFVSSGFGHVPLLGAVSIKGAYGFFVGSLLAGVLGTGLYPIFGPRVWCRNFCPMAAILGIVQKFGRFRIRVKADMCISCGNCSTYCEMGIDVRAYAARNESFTRASCVGCGMCAHVCPRGVLKLENVRDDIKPKTRLPIIASTHD